MPGGPKPPQKNVSLVFNDGDSELDIPDEFVALFPVNSAASITPDNELIVHVPNDDGNGWWRRWRMQCERSFTQCRADRPLIAFAIHEAKPPVRDLTSAAMPFVRVGKPDAACRTTS